MCLKGSSSAIPTFMLRDSVSLSLTLSLVFYILFRNGRLIEKGMLKPLLKFHGVVKLGETI